MLSKNNTSSSGIPSSNVPAPSKFMLASYQKEEERKKKIVDEIVQRNRMERLERAGIKEPEQVQARPLTSEDWLKSSSNSQVVNTSAEKENTNTSAGMEKEKQGTAKSYFDYLGDVWDEVANTFKSDTLKKVWVEPFTDPEKKQKALDYLQETQTFPEAAIDSATVGAYGLAKKYLYEKPLQSFGYDITTLDQMKQKYPAAATTGDILGMIAGFGKLSKPVLQVTDKAIDIGAKQVGKVLNPEAVKIANAYGIDPIIAAKYLAGNVTTSAAYNLGRQGTGYLGDLGDGKDPNKAAKERAQTALDNVMMDALLGPTADAGIEIAGSGLNLVRKGLESTNIGKVFGKFKKTPEGDVIYVPDEKVTVMPREGEVLGLPSGRERIEQGQQRYQEVMNDYNNPQSSGQVIDVPYEQKIQARKGTMKTADEILTEIGDDVNYRFNNQYYFPDAQLDGSKRTIAWIREKVGDNAFSRNQLEQLSPADLNDLVIDIYRNSPKLSLEQMAYAVAKERGYDLEKSFRLGNPLGKLQNGRLVNTPESNRLRLIAGLSPTARSASKNYPQQRTEVENIADNTNSGSSNYPLPRTVRNRFGSTGPVTGQSQTGTTGPISPADDSFALTGRNSFEGTDTVSQSSNSLSPEVSKQLDAFDQSIKKKEQVNQPEVSNPTFEQLMDNATDAKTAAPVGIRDQVKTNSGMKVDVEYQIMNADDVLASNDPFSLQENPNYDQSLQPRDRSKVTYELQLTNMLNNLEPEFLGKNPKSSDGAPIVSNDGMVESGNGRMMTLQRGYASNHPNMDKYRQYLKDIAPDIGLRPEDIDNIPNPVLVRVRKSNLTSEQRTSFIKESNESAMSSLNATEQAQMDSRFFTGDLVQLIDAEGNLDLTSLKNRDFVRAFFNQVVSPNELNRYIDANNQLSQEGLNRIRNAIFAAAYEDSSIIARMAESLDDNAKNMIQALLNVAPRIMRMKQDIRSGALYDVNLTPEIIQALEQISYLRKTGMSVDNFINQLSFIDDVSDETKNLMVKFDEMKRSRAKMTSYLNSVVDALEEYGSPQQLDLFGGIEPPTKLDLLAAAERIEAKKGDLYGTDLFTLRDTELENRELPGGESNGQVQGQSRPTESGTAEETKRLKSFGEGVDNATDTKTNLASALKGTNLGKSKSNTEIAEEQYVNRMLVDMGKERKINQQDKDFFLSLAKSLTKAIEEKDFAYLLERLHIGNSNALKLFEEVTNLPVNNRIVIENSIRQLNPKAFDNYKNDLKIAEKEKIQKEKDEDARKKLEDLENKRESYNGRQITFKQFVQEILDDGKTTVRWAKSGFRNVLELTDAKGSEWMTFRKQEEIDYVLSKVEERGITYKPNPSKAKGKQVKGNSKEDPHLNIDQDPMQAFEDEAEGLIRLPSGKQVKSYKNENPLERLYRMMNARAEKRQAQGIDNPEEDLFDQMTMMGTSSILRNGAKFYDYANRMLDEFGDEAQPYLVESYIRALKVAESIRQEMNLDIPPIKIWSKLNDSEKAAILRTQGFVKREGALNEQDLPDTSQQIGSKLDKEKVTMAERKEKAIAAVVDDTAPIGKVSEEAQKAVFRARGNDNISRVIALEDLVDANGEVIGESLKKAFGEFTYQEQRAFDDYLLVSHSITRMKRGESVYDPKLLGQEMTIQKAQAIQEKLEQKFPNFKKQAEHVYEFQRRFGQAWYVDTGRLTQEAWDGYLKNNRTYVPNFRIFSQLEAGGNTGPIAKEGYANQPTVTKRAKGSERKIVSPMESITEQVAAGVKAARMNEVMQKLINELLENPEAIPGMRIIKTEGPIKIGGELDDEALISLDEEFLQMFNKPGDDVDLSKNNIVFGYVQGKKVHVEVDDLMLLESLLNIAPFQAKGLLGLATKAVSTFKSLTTGLNPIFGLTTNLAADLGDYLVGSTSKQNGFKRTYELLKAFGDVLTNSERYKDFKRFGGGHSSAIAMNRNLLGQTKFDMLSKEGMPLTKKIPGYLRRGFGAFENIVNTTETPFRLAEFNRLNDGTRASKERGYYEASEITTNFMRHGSWGRVIEPILPYFNPAIQGLKRFSDVYRKNPKQALARSIGYISVPTILLYMANRNDPNYQQLDKYTKDNYFVFFVGNDMALKIRKPREIGIAFSSTLERALQYWEKDDPEAFRDFEKSLYRTFLPPGVGGAVQGLQEDGPVGAVTGAMQDTMAGPIVQVASNKDFLNRPIVPRELQDVSNKEQYDDRTSEIGKAFGMLNASPKQVDHLIKQYTGIIGQLVLPATTKGGNVLDTLKRKVTADPVYNNDLANYFYAEMAKEETRLADADKNETPVNRNRMRYMENISKRLSQLRKVEKQLLADDSLTSGDKEKQVRENRRQMNVILADALKYLKVLQAQ